MDNKEIFCAIKDLIEILSIGFNSSYKKRIYCLYEMIFHLTQKLAKKVKLYPLKALQAAHNPFTDWTAHLFTVEHTQYIIITNSLSLYSIVMYGRGITDDNEFIQKTLSSMGEFMTNDGCEFIFRRLIEPYTAQILFAKSTDRRVSGSMNDLIFHAKCLIEERRLSVFETSLKINNIPMSYIGYKYPVEAFRKLKAAGTQGEFA